VVRELIEICYNNVNLEERTFKGDEVVKSSYLRTTLISTGRLHTIRLVGTILCRISLFKREIMCPRTALHKRESRHRAPTKRIVIPCRTLQGSVERIQRTSGSITTMSVIRRILEYYFLQLCGYDGVNLRKDVLETITSIYCSFR
jgi:hypothetical protein